MNLKFIGLMRYSSLPPLICVLFVLSLSCKESTKRLSVLDQAEALMEEQPDSSLTLLEHVENPEKLSSEQYATWILLLTEAKDKTYAVHVSDSLLSIATNYFEKYGDSGKKACTWYYMGRINQDLEQYQDAVRYYQKAIKYAEELSSKKRLMLIYNQLSGLSRIQRLYDESLNFAQKAVEYCMQVNDSSNLPYILRNVGRIYLCLDKIDSSGIYYGKALLVAKNVSHKTQAAILRDMGVNYLERQSYDLAIKSIRESIELNSQNVPTTVQFNLGRSFFYLNKFDSASYYLQQSKYSQDLFTQAGSFLFLYKLAVAKKDFESAISYNDQYQILSDSIVLNSKRDEIKTIIHRYEREELKKKLELDLLHGRIFYGFFIFILIIIVLIVWGGYLKLRWKKERLLRIQERKLEEEKRLRLQSEEQIVANKLQIEANEHLIEINNRQLEQDQIELRDKIDKLISVNKNLLEYKNKLLIKENEMIELNRSVQRSYYEMFTGSDLPKRIKLTGIDERKKDERLAPFKISEMPELIKNLNICFDDFVVRLHVEFPQLKEPEIYICCLLKAGARTVNISEITGMTRNAVTKKKRLILKKMSLEADEEISVLEKYLIDF